MRLTGKRVVVIGGSAGIGLATAQAAAEEGAQVVIASRSAQRLEQARTAIGHSTETHQLDATDEQSVSAFFNQLGAFDHLVVTAASVSTGRFLEHDIAAARSTFDSKFWGQYIVARYAAPQIRREGGSITFFSGTLSQRPARGFAVLAAVNAAVEALCRALALELAPLRVNAVSPGIIDTWPGAEADEQHRSFMRGVAQRLPVGRAGLPDDAARSAIFLMESSYATGTVLYIDGGGRLV